MNCVKPLDAFSRISEGAVIPRSVNAGSTLRRLRTVRRRIPDDPCKIRGRCVVSCRMRMQVFSCPGPVRVAATAMQNSKGEAFASCGTRRQYFSCLGRVCVAGAAIRYAEIRSPHFAFTEGASSNATFDAEFTISNSTRLRAARFRLRWSFGGQVGGQAPIVPRSAQPIRRESA
jgi:hypothetical protein